MDGAEGPILGGEQLSYSPLQGYDTGKRPHGYGIAMSVFTPSIFFFFFFKFYNAIYIQYPYRKIRCYTKIFYHRMYMHGTQKNNRKKKKKKRQVFNMFTPSILLVCKSATPRRSSWKAKSRFFYYWSHTDFYSVGTVRTCTVCNAV